jgi:hypothetical protein
MVGISIHEAIVVGRLLLGRKLLYHVSFSVKDHDTRYATLQDTKLNTISSRLARLLVADCDTSLPLFRNVTGDAPARAGDSQKRLTHRGR